MPPYSLPKTGPLVTLETAHFCTEEPALREIPKISPDVCSQQLCPKVTHGAMSPPKPWPCSQASWQVPREHIRTSWTMKERLSMLGAGGSPWVSPGHHSSEDKDGVQASQPGGALQRGLQAGGLCRDGRGHKKA